MMTAVLSFDRLTESLVCEINVRLIEEYAERFTGIETFGAIGTYEVSALSKLYSLRGEGQNAACRRDTDP